MSVEADTTWKDQAPTSTTVKCRSDGTFAYPTWPQCSSEVSCPDPGNSLGVNRTYIQGQDLQYNSTLRYLCTDPRKYIKVSGTSDDAVARLDTTCQWRKSFPLDGSALECSMHHCGHPYDHPGAHTPPPPEQNITLVTPSGWGGHYWHTSFGSMITYRCDGKTHIENNEADPTVTEYKVECDPTGVYKTPKIIGEVWPNCTDTVICGQPPGKPTNGSVNGVFGYNGTQAWISPATELQDTYDTSVEYKCAIGSQFEKAGVHYRQITNRCLWNKAWSPHPNLPPCVVTHCTHPEEHNPPPALNNIVLMNPNNWKVKDWEVSFGDTITYSCIGSRYFENSDLDRNNFEIDPTQKILLVACLNNGEYESPVVMSKRWPNCTETVNCGQPPEKPINGMINGELGQDGSIVWLYGRESLQETYNTSVEYRCANGSQFDTESGSQTSIQARCQWNKKWSPYHDSLPQCVVTHCIVPFTIPEDTFLEEVTSAWTLVGEDKHYRCQGTQSDGTPTRFWETDRTKSTMQIKCLPDGSYQFEDKRENWPTCLEGKKKKKGF